MKGLVFPILIVFVIGLSTPVAALNEEKFSYITVQNIDIFLDNATADIKMNYTIDDGTQFIFVLLGKQDLKNKVLKILNFDDSTVKSIEMDHAHIQVNDASYTYGRGIYWFPSHDFNVNVPELTIHTPQTTRHFLNVSQFPQGMGYFDSSRR
jgi:hypothetical protein